jgi:hypothetical protein
MRHFVALIADNKFLQAIAIIVAVGTLIGFLYKNIPPAARFVADAVEFGRRKAVRKIMRPIIRRAWFESRDVRLIILSIVSLTFTAVNRLMYFVILVLVEVVGILVAAASGHLHEIIFPGFWKAVISALIGFPVGAAGSWFLFVPFLRLLYFVYWCRRFVRREVWLAHAKAHSP